MKANSYIVTTKQTKVMNTQLNLFGFEEVKKSVKRTVNNFFSDEPDWGDIYDEYLDFEVCAQSWNFDKASFA